MPTAESTGLVLQRPVPVRTQVYEHLRSLILSGRYPPATRLVENRLASEIGVSRTPVREALHALEREGLLEVIPRVGYRVKEIRRDEVVQICAIRRVNESLAVEWALEQITPDELTALDENLRAAEAEVKDGHPEAFVERDAEFHEILVRASRSERLVELCQDLRRHMLVYRVESLYTPANALRALAGHRRIVSCLRAGDRKGVLRAVTEHLTQVERDVLHYAFELPKRKQAEPERDHA